MNVGSQDKDKDVKNFFDSLKIEQDKNRAVLTAVVPPGFIRKAIGEMPGGGPQSRVSGIVPRPIIATASRADVPGRFRDR